METIIGFLLNASIGMVLFYSVYWFFLRKETFYTANRWFLILGLFLSLIIPIFPVQYSVLLESGTNTQSFRTIADTFKHIPVSGEAIMENDFNWKQAVFLIYITGAFIFLLRILTQTAVLIFLMIKCRIKLYDGIRIVENNKYGLPFSFFNIVFINTKFHTQDDLPEILAHEKVHIRENHWFDLLFIELLTVIFWFNPFIWFFERSIKQNHEYLADKGVLAQGHNVGRYQALLLNQLMGMQIIGVTNNLNFALNTNRLKMMTKKKTSVVRRIKFLWALPAIALLLFAFAEPSYKSNEPVISDKSISMQETKNQKFVKMSGTIYDENSELLPGASVVVKGTTIGTVSDREGRFNLEVPENSSIVLSFVGKETLVDDFEHIISGEMESGAFRRNYEMKDAVIVIGTETPPPPPPPPPVSQKGGETIFYIVEDMPQYPGGHAALMEYVIKMQQKLAQSRGIKGKAKVLFTVNSKGNVVDIKVVEKENEEAANGANMIVSGMEDWTPGNQRGKAVPVKYILPVEFK